MNLSGKADVKYILLGQRARAFSLISMTEIRGTRQRCDFSIGLIIDISRE